MGGSTIAEKLKKFGRWMLDGKKPDELDKYRKAGLAALYRKELTDCFRSKRFVIILVLIAVTGLASVYSTALGIQAVLEEQGSDYVFLKLFTSGSDVLPSFLTFMGFLGPLVGLALGFDAINGERSKGTLSRLLAQPIHRDAVINGKFLAGVTVITVMVFSLGLIIGGLGLLLTGVPPSLEELIRLLLFLIFTVVYMSLWLGVSMLFSLLFRHAATSALTVIAIWLFFAIFMSLFAGLIAGAVHPVSDDATAQAVIDNGELRLAVGRISPTELYNEAVGTILDPNVRVLSLSAYLQVQQSSGAIAGPLPLDQSVLLVWPHLVGLLALTLICFAVAYLCFMRQEIRAG